MEYSRIELDETIKESMIRSWQKIGEIDQNPIEEPKTILFDNVKSALFKQRA